MNTPQLIHAYHKRECQTRPQPNYIGQSQQTGSHTWQCPECGRRTWQRPDNNKPDNKPRSIPKYYCRQHLNPVDWKGRGCPECHTTNHQKTP